MPFGGLVVNRVHAAPETNGEVPAELVDELGEALAERVGRLGARPGGAGRARPRRDRPPRAELRVAADDPHPRARGRRPRHRRARAGARPPVRSSKHRLAGCSSLAGSVGDACAAPGRGGRRGRRAGSPAGSRRAPRRARRAPAVARRPAIAARSSEIASRRRRVERRRGPRASAQIAASRSASRSSPGARRRRAARGPPAASRSAPRRRRRARSRARTGAAPTPARRRAGCGGRRGRRTRAAGPPPRRASRQSPAGRRRPVASGTRIHGAAVGARPGGRAERRLGVVPQAQRGLQAAQAAAGALERAAVAGRGLEREHGDGRVRVVAQARSGASSSVCRAHEREPVAERHLVGLDHEPLDGREHDRRARSRRRRPPRARGRRGVEALAVEDEVGDVAPHRGEERLQRGVGLGAASRGGRAAAAARSGRPAGRAAPSRPWRRRVGREPREHPEALGDEAAGQRPVAVQRRRGAALLDQLERDLRARRRPPRRAARRPPRRRRRVSRAARGCACAAEFAAAERAPAARTRSCRPEPDR